MYNIGFFVTKHKFYTFYFSLITFFVPFSLGEGTFVRK